MGIEDQALSQRVYAEVLRWISIIGFVLVAASFLAYLFLPLGNAVPPQALIESWHLSSAELNARLNLPIGWGWMSSLFQGDAISHTSILFLTLGTPLCLATVLAAFARERNKVYFIFVIIQLIVLIFAAFGTGAGGHA